MNKDKLIAFAKKQSVVFPEDSAMGWYLRETLKMLQAEPYEDTVSRANLLKKFENRFVELQKAHQKEKQLGVNWCINTLKDMPPAKPTQNWIPVSERLPKPFTFVNATCKSLVDDREKWVVETMYLPIPKENNEQGYSDWGDIPILNWGKAEVIAWMERKIPEPYKEGKEDMMEKHTDRQIYDGCIHLMQKMVDYFQEYLDYLGYDLDKLDEDERFAVGISNMGIVRQLFLQHTRNSGGCSTIDFCEKLGVDPYKSVKFEFEEGEEE